MTDQGTKPVRCYPRSLAYGDWPPALRKAWVAAQQSAGFLETESRAASWSTRRRKHVLSDAGRFLSWLSAEGVPADSVATLAEAATPAALAAFAKAERARLMLSSLATALGNVVGFVRSLCLDWDAAAAYRMVDRVKRHARLEPRTPRRIADPVTLYKAGLAKMDRCLDERQVVVDPDGWQSGLMVALMAAAPVRIGNFASLVVGKHLQPDPQDGSWWMRLAMEETKTKAPDDWPIPETLWPYLHHHLTAVRPVLLRQGQRADRHDFLWVGTFGQPLQDQGVRKRVQRVTAELLGEAISPHSFRHSAVTGFSLQFADRPRDAAHLLGHASAQTTEKHYLMASRQRALSTLHDALEKRLARIEAQAKASDP